MGDIIPFRTREQWEEEKREQVLKEWEEYLEWEEKTLAKLNKKK